MAPPRTSLSPGGLSRPSDGTPADSVTRFPPEKRVGVQEEARHATPTPWAPLRPSARRIPAQPAADGFGRQPRDRSLAARNDNLLPCLHAGEEFRQVRLRGVDGDGGLGGIPAE